VAVVSLWWWLLIWALLILAALGFVALLGWGLWKQLRALVRELGTASERLSAVLGELERAPAVAAQEPDVFDDPATVRSRVRRRGANAKTSRSGARRRTGT
jgi:hypothetical protein